MKLKINGETSEIKEEAISVTALLTLKEVKMPDMVTVELNGDILDRSAFDSTQVKEGDEVEFIYFMGGGSV